MKRNIRKIQRYYTRQMISAEEFLKLADESTTERLTCGELSRKQANLYSYVGEQEKYFACY